MSSAEVAVPIQDSNDGGETNTSSSNSSNENANNTKDNSNNNNGNNNNNNNGKNGNGKKKNKRNDQAIFDKVDKLSLEEVKEELEKLPMLEKPNEKAFKIQVAEINDNIAEAQKRLNEIADTLREKDMLKQQVFGEAESVRNALNELRTNISGKFAQKKELQNALDDADEDRKKEFAALDKLKKSLPSTSVEKIDETIEQLEYEIQTNTMDLKEEKEILARISSLKSAKKDVVAYQNARNGMGTFDKGELRAELRTVNKDLTALKAEEKRESAALNEIYSQLGPKGEYTKLKKEKDKLHRKLRDHYSEIKKVRNTHNKAKQEFFNNQRMVRALNNAQHRLEKKQRNEEKKKRREEKEAQRAENAEAGASSTGEDDEFDGEELDEEESEEEEQPWAEEIALCDQLISYLVNYLPKEEAKKLKKGKEKADSELGGTKQARQVEDQGEEFESIGKGMVEAEDYFVVTGPKQKKKKKNKKNKAKKEEQGSAQETIMHPADVFADFALIDMTPPMSVDEVDLAIKNVQAKIEEFKSKPAEEGKKKNKNNNEGSSSSSNNKKKNKAKKVSNEDFGSLDENSPSPIEPTPLPQWGPGKK